jgi:DNA-binding MarR family transcriptional regulator
MVKQLYYGQSMETKDDIIQETTRRLFRLLNKHAQLEALPVSLRDGTNLTHRELHVLDAIGEHAQNSVSDVGDRLGVTKSAASQMISKLTKKGLVEKHYASNSNKEYRLRLTGTGKEAFLLHKRVHGKHMVDIIARLETFSLSQIATVSVVLEVMENVVDERMRERLGRR